MFRRFRVLLLVELLEQEEEHDGVHSDPPDESFRVIAVDEQQLESVHHDGQELHHLQTGQILLPPQVFLDFGSQSGQQVVRVHDDVHESVQQTEERTVTACLRDRKVLFFKKAFFFSTQSYRSKGKNLGKH